MTPSSLRMRDLRRLVRDMWHDPRCDEIAAAALDAAIAADAKSCDRAVIAGYLHHFPTAHPAFERLAHASSLAARRRDWPWRERGERWRLWERDVGPLKLSAALMASDDPAALLREAGLDDDLAEGKFVAEALKQACDHAARARGELAVRLGEQLVNLFEQLGVRTADAMLVEALLTPWVERAMPANFADRVLGMLVKRIGDPRFKDAVWQRLLADVDEAQRHDMIAIVMRWLIEKTVREFFTVVGVTTDDPVQWARREAFWLGYLDAQLIDAAWFALGVRAKDIIVGRGKKTRVDHGRIVGDRQYADPSHSSLVLTIGNQRIAEWSHNGACRFWMTQDRQAPNPFDEQYLGHSLRAKNGGEGFEYLAHQGAWESRFAHRIYRMTGIRHPKYQDGYR